MVVFDIEQAGQSESTEMSTFDDLKFHEITSGKISFVNANEASSIQKSRVSAIELVKVVPHDELKFRKLFDRRMEKRFPYYRLFCNWRNFFSLTLKPASSPNLEDEKFQRLFDRLENGAFAKLGKRVTPSKVALSMMIFLGIVIVFGVTLFAYDLYEVTHTSQRSDFVSSHLKIQNFSPSEEANIPSLKSQEEMAIAEEIFEEIENEAQYRHDELIEVPKFNEDEIESDIMELWENEANAEKEAKMEFASFVESATEEVDSKFDDEQDAKRKFAEFAGLDTEINEFIELDSQIILDAD